MALAPGYLFQPNVDLVINFPQFKTSSLRGNRTTTPTTSRSSTSALLASTTRAQGHHYHVNSSVDVCDSSRESGLLCSEKGLLLPFWEPTSTASRFYIAFVYLLAFAYIFIGVSLLSGRVMMAVEVITSKVKVVSMMRDREGRLRPVLRPFWSEVVANLTLYVLGFSAPEILITLVEIAKHDFEMADLGPETIVGSRAYHLFIITAICIVSVPRNQAKRVRRLRVYMMTSFWSIFAYVWIFLIISVISREVIEIWEALVTFSIYPVVVLTAWLFERYNPFKRKTVRRGRPVVRQVTLKPKRNIRASSHSRSSRYSAKQRKRTNSAGPTNEQVALNPLTTKMSLDSRKSLPKRSSSTQHESLMLKQSFASKRDEEAAVVDDDEETTDIDDETVQTPESEMKIARELLGVRLKALKDRFPGRSPLELETMAELSYLSELPKNQSYYRIMATRRFAGEGDVITRERIRAKLYQNFLQLVGIAAPMAKDTTKVVEKRRRLRAGEQRVFFCPAHYVVVECEPFVEVKIMREGAIDRPIEVCYETVDGTAKAGDDYVATSGKIVFRPFETAQTISVGIIDDDEYEDDEYFYCRLTEARIMDAEEGGDHHRPSISAAANTVVSMASTSISFSKTVVRPKKQQKQMIELGPQTEALITILDDDHCGVFGFPGASLVVPDNLLAAEVKVVRSLGAHGRVVVPFILIPVNAVPTKDYVPPSSFNVVFEHREFEKTIKIGVIDRQRAGDDSVFNLKLLDPSLLDEPPPQRSDALPKLGEQTMIKVIITESEVMKDTLDRLQVVGDMGSLFRTTWRSQLNDALTLRATAFVEQDDGAMMGAVRRPMWYEYVLHAITLPWKIMFAFLPPTGICNGWVAFFSCIAFVGIISILIEDLSAHFGCVCGIDKPVTAITIVAVGTSLPDMFASRAAAVHEKTADAALAHISGSNAVNVYLGLGLAWTIAAFHHRFVKGGLDYKPTCMPQHLAANVLLFFAFSIVGLGVLIFRRFSSLAGYAELGGPLPARLITAAILVILYVSYITLTILVNADIIVLNL